MGLFGKRGPKELELFGPGDTLIASAQQIYGTDSAEGTVLFWLIGPANRAHAVLNDLASDTQKAELEIHIKNITKNLTSVTTLHGRDREQSIGLFPTNIHNLVTLAITGSPERVNPHRLELELATVTAAGALRMVELRRWEKANDVLRDGAIQIAALILAQTATEENSD